MVGGGSREGTALAVTMQCDLGAPGELGVTHCSLCIRKGILLGAELVSEGRQGQ